MKISNVIANNHKHAWELVAVSPGTGKTNYVFPYSRAEAVPTAQDPIVELYVDPELGGEGFTYKLESGIEDSVLMDQVLDYNSDPDYVSAMDVYKLTLEAKKQYEKSGLSVREVARRMRTSTTQVYRLLDTTNYGKTMKQLLSFLRVLGFEPQILLRPASDDPAAALQATLNRPLPDVNELLGRLRSESQAGLAAVMEAATIGMAEQDLKRVIDAHRASVDEAVHKLQADVQQVAASAEAAVRQLGGKTAVAKGTNSKELSSEYHDQPKSGTYQLVGPRHGKASGRPSARKKA